jgi:hypothetical protein
VADDFEFEETQEDVYQAFHFACRRLPLADRSGQPCKKKICLLYFTTWNGFPLLSRTGTSLADLSRKAYSAYVLDAACRNA